MSDIKPTPSAPAANEPQTTQTQQTTINHSQEDYGGQKGGNRRRWHEGRNESHRYQNHADDYSDSGSINRKGKRPEVQHYKPPGHLENLMEAQG